MIFYFNSDGSNVAKVLSDVYQGSNDTAKIYFACPTPVTNSVNVAFGLPDGSTSPFYLMTNCENVQGVYTEDGNQYNFWTINLPLAVTGLSGEVTLQFHVTNANDQTIATASNTFSVQPGISSTVPQTSDVYLQLTSLINALNIESSTHVKQSVYSAFVNSVAPLLSEFPSVKSLAQGANKALAYPNYSDLITALNGMNKTDLKVGQSLFVGTLNVPDLWVYGVENSSFSYTFISNENFVSALKSNTYVKVGYFLLSMLETEKTDLSSCIKKTDVSVTDNGDGTATLTISV